MYSDFHDYTFSMNLLITQTQHFVAEIDIYVAFFIVTRCNDSNDRKYAIIDGISNKKLVLCSRSYIDKQKQFVYLLKTVAPQSTVEVAYLYNFFFN